MHVNAHLLTTPPESHGTAPSMPTDRTGGGASLGANAGPQASPFARLLGHHKPMREPQAGRNPTSHGAVVSNEQALRNAESKDAKQEASALAGDEPARRMPDDAWAGLLNAQVPVAPVPDPASGSASARAFGDVADQSGGSASALTALTTSAAPQASAAPPGFAAASAATATAAEPPRAGRPDGKAAPAARGAPWSSSADRTSPTQGPGDSRISVSGGAPTDRSVDGPSPLPAPATTTAALSTAGQARLSAMPDWMRPMTGVARRPAEAASAGSNRGTEHLAAMGALMGAPANLLPSAPPAVVSVSLPEPAHSPEFREALGAQVSFLAADGIQQAELHLNPAEMGPISVRIVLEGTQAHVEFGADSAATRQIIEAGLPELASALRDAGLTLSGGGVSQRIDEPEAQTDPNQAQNGAQSSAQADSQARQQQDETARGQADHSAGTKRDNLSRGHGGVAPEPVSGQAARQHARASAGGVDLYA